MYVILRHLRPNALLVRTGDFWTVEEADRYVVELAAALDELRRDRDYALLFLDSRDSPPQSAAVMERFAEVERMCIRTPLDRVAIAVASGILKYQMQRLSHSKQVRVFLSASAAETWLFAHEHAPAC